MTKLKARLDPARAYAATWEREPDADGALVPTAVVFLTNKQCPFRCVMCDLWINTLDQRVPLGAIPRQIRDARTTLPPADHIKLYNAGSFFDPDAIPPEDDDEIAREVAGYTRVIVEAHPAFLTGRHAERCLRFRDRLTARLEVAVGLETADAAVLERLNKAMTLDAFARSAGFLRAHDIDLRVFILLKPPLVAEDAGVEWACRSIDFAREHGASVCSVIPLRGDEPPRLRSLEQVVEHGLETDMNAGLCDVRMHAVGSQTHVRRGRPSGRPSAARVFADLWDIERLFDCACSPARAERLRQMNLTQRVAPPVSCASCDR